MEIQHPAGVRIVLKKKDCLNTIALIDALGTGNNYIYLINQHVKIEIGIMAQFGWAVGGKRRNRFCTTSSTLAIKSFVLATATFLHQLIFNDYSKPMVLHR